MYPDFEPVQFSFSGVVAQAGPIPLDVKIVRKGTIAWTSWTQPVDGNISDVLPTKAERAKGQEVRPGLLKDFLALEDGTDEKVCAFIRQWGCLAIEAEPSEITKVASSFATHPRDADFGDFVVPYFKEQTETYRRWARRARAVLNIARALQRGELAQLEDWEFWYAKQSEERAVAQLKTVFWLTRDVFPKGENSPNVEVQKAMQNLVSQRQASHQAWEDFKRYRPNLSASINPDAHLTEEAVLLFHITDNWISTESLFVYNIEGARGQATQTTLMDIALPMQNCFWNKNLASLSALLPIGQALLHTLQSPIVSCKVCGEAVAPAQKRRDRAQFCSPNCKASDQRRLVRENNAKIKARKRAS